MMRERRFEPLRRIKVKGPTQLASLAGDRKPGSDVNCSTSGKAPKRQFKLGQLFHYDGDVWEIIYMYRMSREPGVWFHCLECQSKGTLTSIGDACMAAGAGETTPRIVLTPFQHYSDVENYFRDIYRNGDSAIKTTQELLKMKRA